MENMSQVSIQELTKINPEFTNFADTIKDKISYNSQGECVNAFETLCDINSLSLYAAYYMLKSKPGNMVAGADKATLDGINEKWFKVTNHNLLNESWQAKPSRRVLIPKANGKMRPLGISSPRDKIVQQSMKMMLETVLEPYFSESSHGFRPHKGCHTALREIRNWKGVTWFIEGDIIFDNIDHNILDGVRSQIYWKNALETRDLSTGFLYWKFVKAGYVEWDSDKKVYVNSDMGVPQGGIISPILSNLMLNKLDTFMDQTINSLEKQNGMGIKPYIKSTRYNNLTMQIDRLKKRILRSENSDETTIFKARYKKLYKTRRKLKSVIPNPEYVNMKYVRYADDWLIGVWGDKNAAKQIKDRIFELLSELKLDLSVEKTLITNAREKRAKFLGTFIKRIASNKNTHYIVKEKGQNRRAPTGNLWMSAPIHEIIKTLPTRGKRST